MINVTKMEEAFELARKIDTLLFDAGVYDEGVDTASSFQSFYQDLEIDIVRVKSGDV